MILRTLCASWVYCPLPPSKQFRTQIHNNLTLVFLSPSPSLPPSSQALSTYGSDSEMTGLLNQMDVYVLPVFNIDGYDFTHNSVCFPLAVSH